MTAPYTPLTETQMDAYRLAELQRAGRDKFRALARSLRTSPSALNGLLPRVLRIAGAHQVHAVDFRDTWQAVIDSVQVSGEAALVVAGGADPARATRRIARMSFEDALATQDASVIARWGLEAVEAAAYSRADMLIALGLEELVDDALPGARHVLA